MTTIPPAVVPLTDAEIIAHYRARTPLPQLQRSLDANHQQALHAQLAALHNAGTIDMLALTATSEFLNLDRQHFFTIQQIYHGIIPLLEAPARAMLEAVQRLAQEGPNAGTPAMLVHALCRWLGQSPGRASDIIAVAQADAGMDPEVLSEALVTLADLKLVKSLLRVADQRRRAAISALGRIKPQDLQAADEAFAELVAIAATDPDDGMRFTAIFAAFGLSQHCEANAPQWVPRLIAAAAAAPSESAPAALLQGLWRQSGLFQADDVKATLALACEADLFRALLGTLDGTLSHLVRGPHHDLAIDCLTNLLASDGKKVSLDDLPGLKHSLMTLDRTQLFAIAIRWFTTGDPQLCQGVTSLIAPPRHQAQPFDTTLDGWGLSGSLMITICHKAVGYLILAPVVAASFVVAALRAGDKSAEPELVQLLLQSLLINYGETVAVYLKGFTKGDEAYRPVHQALKLHRAYAEGLNIETTIKELLPSSYQRGAVRQKHYVMQRDIRKETERQSVFFELAQHSTLLYGCKAITYLRGANEPPVSVEMKTVSAHFEMPRLQIIDPVRLDWLIRIFRLSRPK
jgi:hypothetical protein